MLADLREKLGWFQGALAAVRAHGPAARQDAGKALLTQFHEIVALRRGAGKLDPDEYYQYRLYDDSRFTWSQKAEFLGRRLENGLVPVLGEDWWIGLAHDKLVTAAFLRGLGYPTPEIYGVYHPWRASGGARTLPTREALTSFLRGRGEQALVAKPVTGMWGRHVLAIRRYDPADDTVVLTNQSRLSPEQVADRFDERADPSGTLLQELLEPHPCLRELCGPRICSVRMVSLVDDAGPRLLSCVWKVATGASMADNYWEPGNLIAPIEPDTGRVGRPFTGLGRDIQYVDRHPDTGRPLTGVVLPEWQTAVSLCLDATRCIPGIPMQAWDVALTSRGPVLLEVNVNGGMRLPQLAAGAGLYRGEFRTFLHRFGYPA
jgi:hypothetical protein